jgi:hypothetical protein
MPYSKFDYPKIRKELAIHNDTALLFNNIKPMQASDWLQQTMLMAKDVVALFSEKSRSEAIVYPILSEIRVLNQKNLSLYSGAVLNADESKGLNGECDFILSAGKQDFYVDTPLFCMIEAEDNDIEKNIPQCIAQMEGARIYNETEGKKLEIIYGCVTTGTEWQFLKLANKTCWIDSQRFYINDLPLLLGMLQAIVDVQLASCKG